jgi:hypothetical protein
VCVCPPSPQSLSLVPAFFGVPIRPYNLTQRFTLEWFLGPNKSLGSLTFELSNWCVHKMQQFPAFIVKSSGLQGSGVWVSEDWGQVKSQNIEFFGGNKKESCGVENYTYKVMYDPPSWWLIPKPLSKSLTSSAVHITQFPFMKDPGFANKECYTTTWSWRTKYRILAMSSQKCYQLPQDTAMQSTREDNLRAVCGPMLDPKKNRSNFLFRFNQLWTFHSRWKVLEHSKQILQIALRTEFYEP